MPTLTIAASIDAFISQPQPNTNYGADPGIAHGVVYAGSTKTQWRRGIVNFNAGALAGRAVVEAKLVRDVSFVTGAGGVTARLSRCTRPLDWVETQVTWNNYKNGSAWTNGGGDYDQSTPPAIDYAEPNATGTHEIPGLKPFVLDALALRGGIVSLITRLLNEDPDVTQEIGWRAREYGAAGWRLVVEYEVPDAGRRGGRSQMHRGAQPAGPARPAAGVRPWKKAGSPSVIPSAARNLRGRGYKASRDEGLVPVEGAERFFARAALARDLPLRMTKVAGPKLRAAQGTGRSIA